MGKVKISDLEKVTENLNLSYCRWSNLYLNGGSDPHWEDGVNLNILRNHIIYYKSVLESMLGCDFYRYPDSYFFPEPVRLPSQFMATSRLCGVPREFKSSTRVEPLSEVLKFDWSEVLEGSY